ncbi:MAG: hypothetical protein B7Z69_02530 [Actinobacteria bacterium 21-73-9]|nr:MAG: hypothetical protein B7Z69_02530 [Actinobacteria bacterium 21-73-9]
MADGELRAGGRPRALGQPPRGAPRDPGGPARLHPGGESQRARLGAGDNRPALAAAPPGRRPRLGSLDAVAESAPVVVVGAGLAGLRCAQVLGERGVDVVVLERADHVGGRVHSFAVDGYRVDQGFQLVNPAYPELLATGVLEGLDLRPLPRSVEVRRRDRRLVLADPLRHPGAVAAAVRLAPPGSWARFALGLARSRSHRRGASAPDPTSPPARDSASPDSTSGWWPTSCAPSCARSCSRTTWTPRGPSPGCSRRASRAGAPALTPRVSGR